MRLERILVAMLCLGIATASHAKDLSFGPMLAFPLPGHGIGSDQLGIDAGFVLNGMETSSVGVGLDVAFHYWPASIPYMTAFDNYLYHSRYEHLDSPTWAYRMYQVTPHLRLVTPPGRRFRPWLQIGGGLYVMDQNLVHSGGLTPQGPWAWPNNSNLLFTKGWNCGVGFDAHPAGGLTAGLDGTYHHVWATGNRSYPEITALTAGMHVTFGR